MDKATTFIEFEDADLEKMVSIQVANIVGIREDKEYPNMCIVSTKESVGGRRIFIAKRTYEDIQLQLSKLGITFNKKRV